VYAGGSLVQQASPLLQNALAWTTPNKSLEKGELRGILVAMTNTLKEDVTLFENYLANNLMGEGCALGISGTSRILVEALFSQANMTPPVLAGLVADIADEQSLDLDAAVEVCANEIYAALDKIN